MYHPSCLLQTERVEIVDGQGRTRVAIGLLGPEADPGIALYDEAGNERVSLALDFGGPLLSFALGGFGVMDIGVSDPEDCEGDATPARSYGWSIGRAR